MQISNMERMMNLPQLNMMQHAVRLINEKFILVLGKDLSHASEVVELENPQGNELYLNA